MSLAASVALAVAEKVERTGGPRAGLVAWKTLAGNAADGEVRGKALLSALRCAIVLRDVEALVDLTALWTTVDRGVWDGPIVALCMELVRIGLLPRATALAHADVQRLRTARSLYCYARCLDVARDEQAPAAFRAATERAEKEGASAIALASRVRRAVILARSWDTMGEALADAQRIDPTKLQPTSRLMIARILLRAPSRFTRAAAIGLLDEVAMGGDDALALRALGIAARWTDDVGDALTPLETDRLRAMFGRERAMKHAPDAKEVLRILERIAWSKDNGELEAALTATPELEPLHTRARDILRGRFEVLPEEVTVRPPAGIAERRMHRWSELLDIVVAMRDGAPARAARVLRMLAEAEVAGEHLPVQVLGIAEAALAHEDQELRQAAIRLFAVRLRAVAMGAPPRGWGRVADTLAALGEGESAARARHAAVVAKEPGAAESLGTSLAREGWELAKSGDREHAIRKLHEAKTLLGSTVT